MTPHPVQVAETVRRALAEDVGPGDVTTAASVPAEVQGRGVFLAKQEGVLAGLVLVRECFAQGGPDCELTEMVAEGAPFRAGDILAQVDGPAQQVLTTERVALNFLQRLCGVATLTRAFVQAVAGTGAQVLDTRKTTPGLRALEKAAVRAGGGRNHRFALYDGVLLKDNHTVAAGGITAAVLAARAVAPPTLRIEVETTSLEQVEEALCAGADIIMLDNMDCPTMRAAVELIGGRALTEASGGVSLETVAEIAATGVDFISVGKLTHSAPAIDISLELELAGR